MQISNRTLHGSVATGDIRKFRGGGCTLAIASEKNVQNVWISENYRGKISASLKSLDFASAFVLVFVSAHSRK